MRLKDKVSIITGASRGIGKEIAIQFAKEGSSVVLNFKENKNAATEVEKEIQSLGHSVFIYQADVTDRSQIRAMFEFAANKFGRIDVLVNNAGINKRGFFDEVNDDDWDNIMNVNLKGPFICSQEVFPYMKSQNFGRIINISSVAGQYHGPKTVHYAVSKAGLNSLTKVIARYGAPYNILVNAVAPGIMLTEQTADELSSVAGQKIVDLTLLKRPGKLSDIAMTCVLLGSEEQNYITGQVISVSGGAYLS